MREREEEGEASRRILIQNTLQILAVSREGTRFLDSHSLDGLVTASSGVRLNLLDDIHALKDLAENDVAAVEPRGDDGGNEELQE